MVVDRFSFSYINESSVLVSRNLVEQWFTNAILGNVSDLTRVISFPVLVNLAKSWSSSEVTGDHWRCYSGRPRELVIVAY
jgi:IS1 family transposase